MTEEDRALPRKRDIEAAIAAYNDTAQAELRLPPDEARLLAAMFPRRSVRQRSFGDLLAQGFAKGTLRHLLRALIEVGLVSNEPAPRGVIAIYRLHLPLVRR